MWQMIKTIPERQESYKYAPTTSSEMRKTDNLDQKS